MTTIAGGLQLKVAGYARVSTEEQAKGQSVDTQIFYLKKWAEAQSWNYTKSYEDPGFSGGTEDRPALQELLQDADKRLFDAVIVNNTDRVSRDADYAFVFYRRMHNNGIGVGILTLAQYGIIRDLEDPAMNMMLRMMSTVDEYFRKITRFKTKMGMKKLASEGRHMGRPPAFYTIGEDGRLSINNDVIQKIWQIAKESPVPKRKRPYRYYSAIARALDLPYFQVYYTMKRIDAAD